MKDDFYGSEHHGYIAYHAGLLPGDNPIVDGPGSVAWSRGYDAAKATGPPDPSKVSAADAAVVRREALFDRAIDVLEEAAFNYVDALREYYAAKGLHKKNHELYEEMLEFIEQAIGTRLVD
jgi:hypothetical protein